MTLRSPLGIGGRLFEWEGLAAMLARTHTRLRARMSREKLYQRWQ